MELSCLHVLDVAIIKVSDYFYAMLYVCMICIWIPLDFRYRYEVVDVFKILKSSLVGAIKS